MEVERATRSRNDAGQLPIQLKQDLWPHGCHHLPPAVCWDWRFLLWSFLRNHKEIMQEEATCLRSGHGHADHKRSALITGLNEPERTQTSFRGDTYGHIDLSVDESDLGLFVNTNTHTHSFSHRTLAELIVRETKIIKLQLSSGSFHLLPTRSPNYVPSFQRHDKPVGEVRPRRGHVISLIQQSGHAHS